MRNLERLIWECPSVDGVSTSSVSLLKITSLQHEPRDDSVELGVLETVSSLACRQDLEILDRFGGSLFEKLHQDPSGWDIVNGDVEVDDGSLIDGPGTDERDGGQTGKFVEDGLLG